jgi:hypothetical protein
VRRLLFATLLVSAGAIGYELLLMRVLSIVQWHHFAYMIISLALLGYGASGTAIALLRHRLEPHFETAFAASAGLFSVTMVVCFALGQRVPFNALEIVWDPWQFASLSLIYLLFFVPFFFAASCIGLTFTCRRTAISKIYFFDLLGAGLGAVVIIGLLFRLMPQHAVIVLAVLPLAASLLIGAGSTARLPLALTQLLWLVILASGATQDRLDLRISEYKGLSQALQVIDSRVLAVSSSPLGLLTVVESPTVPFRHAPGLSFNTRHVPPEQLAIFSDADSMSVINRFDGQLEALAYLGDITAALPYALLDKPKVLVLGAGAGSDLLLALYHGAIRVDAVELNPQMTAFVQDRYSAFAGKVYDDPRIELHIKGLLDSFGASGSGVQSLNESYIYTVEALREYMAHAIEAMRANGISDPGKRLVAIRSWNTSTLLIRNGEFTPEEIGEVREFANSRSFDTTYFPAIDADHANRFNLLEQAYLYDGTQALLGEHAEEYVERYKFQIEPATDDRPYYFHFFKWATLPEVMSLRKAGGAGLIEWGYLILVATLLQAVVAGLILILVPLARIERSWPDGTGLRMGGYFLLLGFAFLFVEMAFIQKFILFLSHPLYSVAVVLSGFLVFAGLGSAASDPLARRLEKTGGSLATLAVGGIAIVSLGYVFLLPVVFKSFIGFADTAKIAVSILMIAPLAFCMGIPFPVGLMRLAERAPDFIPWAWGINGFASVTSAVLATLLAIEFGFTSVIVLALFIYGVAAAALRNWS